MKIPILFFLFLSTNAFSQADTLYLSDSLIYLSNGEILQPGLLPVNTPSISYIYTGVNGDTDLLLVNGKLKDGGTITGFYRRLKRKANDGTFYYSWEQDLLWITIDSNNKLVEQNLYSEGVLLKATPIVHIQYR
ncbi:hypothetical protein [Fluviicola sp.]|uniref:hypothetical protein n=1 Tax=Fluviicola sp. TaxID=1917219 RepID=UPI003D2C6B6D